MTERALALNPRYSNGYHNFDNFQKRWGEKLTGAGALSVRRGPRCLRNQEDETWWTEELGRNGDDDNREDQDMEDNI